MGSKSHWNKIRLVTNIILIEHIIWKSLKTEIAQ